MRLTTYCVFFSILLSFPFLFEYLCVVVRFLGGGRQAWNQSDGDGTDVQNSIPIAISILNAITIASFCTQEQSRFGLQTIKL